MPGNREYKSDVFSMLMEDKGVSLSVRNDAAFILDANLSVYEHQSSVCPNMPVRSLIYFTNILERLLKNRNIYGYSKIRIPVPKFAVFYNGKEAQPEQKVMKLSDAFEHPVNDPELELTCRVYNINQGHNKVLLDKCPVLREYMIFVDYVREYHEKENYENLETAINLAIDRCMDENILGDFLREHRSEVVKVTQLDYTFDRQITLEREEARQAGREEGRKEGREKGKEEGREEERIAAIRNMIYLDVPKERILTKYSEEDYRKATNQ
ncbi:MAG: hypothetical protein PUA77_03175 [Lachnospiraceae bacterium]|nr:hypothetical protein [Agathobacter sp.]MDD6290781.1 hypothetical protein [Lachnospiraceae bacterium]